MKLRKPVFKDLVDNYKTETSSVHDCPRIYQKDSGGTPNVNTCAIRISEALVIALGLVESRTKIAKLGTGAGTGKSHLFGKYNYRDNLCPHGIGRGARDVAYFLQEHWGKPTHTFKAPGSAPAELTDKTGVIAFIKMPTYPNGQGHMDVWNKTRAVGSGYFDAEKVMFWQLD